MAWPIRHCGPSHRQTKIAPTRKLGAHQGDSDAAPEPSHVFVRRSPGCLAPKQLIGQVLLELAVFSGGQLPPPKPVVRRFGRPEYTNSKRGSGPITE